MKKKLKCISISDIPAASTKDITQDIEDRQQRIEIIKKAKETYIEVLSIGNSILATDDNNALEVAHVLKNASESFLWLKKYCVPIFPIDVKKELYRDEDGDFYKGEYPNRKGEHIRTEFWRSSRDMSEINSNFNDLKFALTYLKKIKSSLK
jgi:hypothetical protein